MTVKSKPYANNIDWRLVGEHTGAMVQQTSSESGSRARRAYDQLADIGTRRTIARQLVLDALDESGGHRSAADIHARIIARAPTVTLSTVYRTLATLTDRGLVHTLTQGNEVHYGFADAPHHHGVCSRCGTTVEIPAEAVAELIKPLQRASGLILAPDGITLTGLCRACAAGERKSAART
jgi:Fur family ferric uptake transcriptional regulator